MERGGGEQHGPGGAAVLVAWGPRTAASTDAAEDEVLVIMLVPLKRRLDVSRSESPPA